MTRTLRLAALMLGLGGLCLSVLCLSVLCVSAPALAQQPQLQLQQPGTLQRPDERPNSDLRLQPPGQGAGGRGFQLRDPSGLTEEQADDALDDMLEEPWPDEESDGDFDEPLEGELADPLDAYDEAEPEALDPDTAELLDGEFGEPGHEHGAEGEEHEHGPGAEHGEDGEHAQHEAHFDPIAFLATLVNFLIWLAVVVWLGRKPVSEYLKNRRTAVEEGLEEARRLSSEAREKHAEYSTRLERLDEELEKLRDEMIQAGEAEGDRIIQEAEARAARMRKDASFLVDQQMKQLRVDLTREAIEAAVQAAEDVLTKQVAAGDHQRLADDYLEQIAESIKDEEARA